MSYIDKNLLTDEKILFRTKKSFIIFLGPFCWSFGAIICLFNSNPYVVKLSFIFAIAAAVLWIKELINYATSDFAITNKRIIMREGFLYRHTNETRLSTITTVSVTQSLLGQVFNYGAVFIDSFGGTTDTFTEIDKPNVFQNKLQEQIK